MDLSAFFTLPNGIQQPQTGKPLTGEALGLTNANQNFMDLFLANVMSKSDEKDLDVADTHEPLSSDNPTLSKADAVSLLQTLAANEDIAEDVEINGKILDSTFLQDIQNTLALNEASFTQILNPLTTDAATVTLEEQPLETLTINDLFNLTDGEAEGEGIYEATDLLQAILAKHEALTTNSVQGAVNLSPEQITQVLNKIEAALKASDTPIKQMSEVTDPEVFALIQTLIPAVQIQPVQDKPKTTITASTAQTDVLLPPLQKTGQAPILLTPQMSAETVNTTDHTGSEGDPSRADVKFKDILSAIAPTAKDIDIAIKTFKGVQPLPATIDATLLASSDTDAALNQFFDDIPPALRADASPLTNSVTVSSVRAGQPHSAMQTVIMTMQKAGSDGVARDITLQLDPPELGRVEVKMNFDKNAKMKAVMTVEKPETLALLQRDAQMLERAMQDMGIDADSGISFELADGGHDFNQNGRHDGSRNQTANGGADNDGDTIEITDTTMTWDVDPATGHVHYSIMV